MALICNKATGNSLYGSPCDTSMGRAKYLVVANKDTRVDTTGAITGDFKVSAIIDTFENTFDAPTTTKFQTSGREVKTNDGTVKLVFRWLAGNVQRKAIQEFDENALEYCFIYDHNFNLWGQADMVAGAPGDCLEYQGLKPFKVLGSIVEGGGFETGGEAIQKSLTVSLGSLKTFELTSAYEAIPEFMMEAAQIIALDICVDAARAKVIISDISGKPLYDSAFELAASYEIVPTSVHTFVQTTGGYTIAPALAAGATIQLTGEFTSNVAG